MTATPNESSKNTSEPSVEFILGRVLDSLEDLKGIDVRTMGVTGISDVTDWMVLASGTSSRHVRSLVDRVVDDLKKESVRPLGIEGKEASEWVLVDYGDVVLHVMQTETRGFYDLERLWGELPGDVEAADASTLAAGSIAPDAADRSDGSVQ